VRINIFSILFNQNKHKMKTHYSRCLSMKQALIHVTLWRVRGAAYFRKQLDVFIVLISMTTANVKISEKTSQSWLKTLDPNGI